jgi:hypothetical protein
MAVDNAFFGRQGEEISLEFPGCCRQLLSYFRDSASITAQLFALALFYSASTNLFKDVRSR